MTIDDAAAILDVTEGHVKKLLRTGKLLGWKNLGTGVNRRRFIWAVVDGKDVRKRRRELGRRRG